MANTHRYRYGDEEIIDVLIPTNVSVEVGDFICRATSADVVGNSNLTENYGCPAKYLVDAGDAAANREAAADQFLGIAKDYHKSGDSDHTSIRVATAGFFELTQKTAAAIHIGDGVEIYASASAPESQTVVEGATSPIAVCVEHKTSTSLTAVLCKLLPSKLLGTPQG